MSPGVVGERTPLEDLELEVLGVAVAAGLDAEGNPVAWEHRIVGQSIVAGTAFEQMLIVDEVDQTSVEGAKNLPYRIPNLLVDLPSPELGVPVQWWRAVGSTHTGFAVECMVDEMAAAAGRIGFEAEVDVSRVATLLLEAVEAEVGELRTY